MAKINKFTNPELKNTIAFNANKPEGIAGTTKIENEVKDDMRLSGNDKMIMTFLIEVSRFKNPPFDFTQDNFTKFIHEKQVRTEARYGITLRRISKATVNTCLQNLVANGYLTKKERLKYYNGRNPVSVYDYVINQICLADESRISEEMAMQNNIDIDF